MLEQTDQEKYLQKHKAWKWQWPGEKNQWDTRKRRARGKSQAYSGPSKRTRAKRAARALRH